MRAIISPSGSFKAMLRSSLPARLEQTRDHALGAEVAQCNAGQLVLAIEAARPPVISQRLRTRVADELRGSSASLSTAANRSSIGFPLSRTIALSRVRRAENFLVSRC